MSANTESRVNNGPVGQIPSILQGISSSDAIERQLARFELRSFLETPGNYDLFASYAVPTFLPQLTKLARQRVNKNNFVIHYITPIHAESSKMDTVDNRQAQRLSSIAGGIKLLLQHYYPDLSDQNGITDPEDDRPIETAVLFVADKDRSSVNDELEALNVMIPVRLVGPNDDIYGEDAETAKYKSRQKILLRVTLGALGVYPFPNEQIVYKLESFGLSLADFELEFEPEIEESVQDLGSLVEPLLEAGELAM